MNVSKYSSILILILLALVSLNSRADHLHCNVEHGIYALKAHPSIKAEIVFRNSTVAIESTTFPFLKIVDDDGAEPYWFLMNRGNGVGHVSLVPVQEPIDGQEAQLITTKNGARLPSTPFFQFDEKMAVWTLIDVASTVCLARSERC